MNVLLIEDDEEKAKKVTECVESSFNAQVTIARSFNSALRTIIANSNKFNIILLDMTLPTFDVSPQEPGGGAPENFAGKELLAQMKLRGIDVPTVVVTQFDSFGDGESRISLDALADELRKKFSPQFLGYVYYNSAQEGWRTALQKLIDVSGYKEERR